MTVAKKVPDRELLLRLLDYDADTGLLTWRHRGPDLFKPGALGSPQSMANAWNKKFAGKSAFSNVSSKGHLRGKINDSSFYTHRIIWKMIHDEEPEHIDHINGICDDNRLSNLRAATAAQNAANYSQPKKTRSTFRGVHPSRSRWKAVIHKAGRNIHLGSFATEIEAAKAYDKAARLYQGEFATLNFSEATHV